MAPVNIPQGGTLWDRFLRLDDPDQLRTQTRRTLLQGRHPDQTYINELIDRPRNYDIRRRILLYAGRQAAASFRIAIPKNETEVQEIADSAVFYEPFNYWDWVGHYYHFASREAPRDHSGLTSSRKRRLLWERERTFFKKDDNYPGTERQKWRHIRHYHPTPPQQWDSFKSQVERHENKRSAVTRLALAGWMDGGDLDWVVKNLHNLRFLDLSLINSEFLLNRLEDESPLDSQMKLFPSSDNRVRTLAQLLRQLDWLGIPDSRCIDAEFRNILKECTNLQTLSVRGLYDGDFDSRLNYHHENVYFFTQWVVDIIPDSVLNLELRVAIGFMPLLLKYIRKSKPHVKRVGIDLGAWVQMYPFRFQSRKPLKDLQIGEKAQDAAQTAVDAVATFPYVENVNIPSVREIIHSSNGDVIAAHRRTIDAISQVSRDDNSSFFCDKSGTPFDPRVANTSECDGKCNIDGIHEELDGRNRATTLSRMLRKLHHAFTSVEHIEPYALQPEAKARSTDPLNPFTLVQERTYTHEDHGSNFDGQLTEEIYRWLGAYLKWQPVFDWDRLFNVHRVEEYEDVDARDSPVPEQLERVTFCFQIMNKAKIPVHILIGRRDPRRSSCYWGWPYTEQDWRAKLEEDEGNSIFTGNLHLAAPYVNTLSVFYDIRNPLDRDRLAELEGIESEEKLPGNCPKRKCPWDDDRPCPFGRLHSLGPSTQTRASKSAIAPEVKLAPMFEGDPPPGKIPDLHSHGDQDPDHHGRSMHGVARNAVFAREMYGWHRFWNTMASQFTGLTMLRVRMPQYFDRIWSYRLARLLKPEIGWEAILYTNEVEHAQTELDLIEKAGGDSLRPEKFRHEKLMQKWSAGPFVRRTWVWREYSPGEKGTDFDPAPRKRQNWGYRVGAYFKTDIDSLEKAQADKAKKLAQRCANIEGGRLDELFIDPSQGPGSTRQAQQAGVTQPSFTFPPISSVYVQHLRNIAGDQYRAILQQYATIVEESPHHASHLSLMLRRYASRPPPYHTIFRRPDNLYVEDIGLVPDQVSDNESTSDSPPGQNDTASTATASAQGPTVPTGPPPGGNAPTQTSTAPNAPPTSEENTNGSVQSTSAEIPDSQNQSAEPTEDELEPPENPKSPRKRIPDNEGDDAINMKTSTVESVSITQAASQLENPEAFDPGTAAIAVTQTTVHASQRTATTAAIIRTAASLRSPRKKPGKAAKGTVASGGTDARLTTTADADESGKKKPKTTVTRGREATDSGSNDPPPPARSTSAKAPTRRGAGRPVNSGDPEIDNSQYATETVAVLKQRLASRSLTAKGNKPDLIKALIEDDKAHQGGGNGTASGSGSEGGTSRKRGAKRGKKGAQKRRKKNAGDGYVEDTREEEEEEDDDDDDDGNE
ncbi:unnamed protein product [Periconia digitata]|uniref:SAP domain-containing protein n=1 Tax=Periconia digitata TaxID=1303443 RepID=A0A9W4UEM0_9PLEO|nr:unnamed protein product [Periconia digitata]